MRNCQFCGNPLRSEKGRRTGMCASCRVGTDILAGKRHPRSTHRYATAEQVDLLIDFLKTPVDPQPPTESPGA